MCIKTLCSGKWLLQRKLKCGHQSHVDRTIECCAVKAWKQEQYITMVDNQTVCTSKRWIFKTTRPRKHNPKVYLSLKTKMAQRT